VIVALSHGYPPIWNLGGEVSLHRMMRIVDGPKAVLTNTTKPYEIDGVKVMQINTPDVLNINSDPVPVADQLRALGATVVVGQNELALVAVKAARILGIPSIVSSHTPPKYGKSTAEAIYSANFVVHNTQASAVEWDDPHGFVLHPPMTPLPAITGEPQGDAYTLLSSLTHKGVQVVRALAQFLPKRRFIIVRSPAANMEPPKLVQMFNSMQNVEIHKRVAPDEVAETFFSQTRILLVPGRYETYGMSAIEAAGYGIPSVSVDTPHVREGIGNAADLIRPLNVSDAHRGVERIEKNYSVKSLGARDRAEWIADRQVKELAQWKKLAARASALGATAGPSI